MKKMYLLAAMALMMIGCSSNDEDKLPADELLAGTEWRYGTFMMTMMIILMYHHK